MACSHGNLEAVKIIVEDWGVDVSTAAVHSIGGLVAVDVRMTPLFLAGYNRHNKIVRYLTAKGAQLSSSTTLAVRTPPEHLRWNCGATPLHAAVRNSSIFSNHEGRVSTIRILLECGADPSALTQDDIPVWSTLYRDGIEITTLLVQWGLDLSQRCPKTGITLLHLWAGNRGYGNKDEILGVVKMILEKGADPQARDNNGLSVILMAAIGDCHFLNLLVMDYLLER